MGGDVLQTDKGAGADRTGSVRVVGLLALLLALSPSAYAGAWTQAEGKGLILSSLGHHDFELEAEGFGYAKLESALYLEYGLTDRVTLVGRLSQETRFHRSRIELNKRGSVFVQSVTTVTSALGESELGVRVGLGERLGWTLSAQGALVRFSREPQSLPETPAGWGADARLQLGRSLGSSAFVDMALAHRADWDGGHEETRVDLGVGVRPAENWLLLAQSYSAWGEAASTAYRSRYESHRVHLSVIAPVREGLSLQLGVINSVATDRRAPETAYMVTLWREF